MPDVKQQKQGEDDNPDRICSLPEPILQLIMSFLPLNQIVQLSVLSKTWLQAWRSYPDLEIHQFLGEIDSICGRDKVHTRKTYSGDAAALEFANIWICQAISICGRDKVHTRKTYSGDAAALEFANRWVCQAIEYSLKELHENEHLLPRTDGGDDGDNVRKKLLSLKKLHLSRVDADDQVVTNNLVAQCPLIEDLSFHYGQCFDKCLDIEALNNADSISIVNLRGCKINITSCKNLNSVYFSHRSYTDREWLNNTISKLLLLDQLIIRDCNKLETIHIFSPRLKKLVIQSCEKLVSVSIEAPNLSVFRYQGDVVSLLTLGALPDQLETDFCFSSKSTFLSPEFYVKYIQLLAQLHHISKLLNLQTTNSKIVDVPELMRRVLPPPLYGAKHLNFTAPTGSVAKIMDFLLWISPHPESVCLKHKYQKNFYFQFTYKGQPVYGGKIAQCCRHLPVSCWKHCIVKVKVEVASENTTTNEVFVFEGENILEKIDDGLAEFGFE